MRAGIAGMVWCVAVSAFVIFYMGDGVMIAICIENILIFLVACVWILPGLSVFHACLYVVYTMESFYSERIFYTVCIWR